MHDVSAWVGEGRIKYREDVVEGLKKRRGPLLGYCVARTSANFWCASQLAKKSNTGIVVNSALSTNAKEVIVTTTARLRLPTIYPYSFFAQNGGLLSYGFDVRDMFQQ